MKRHKRMRKLEEAILDACTEAHLTAAELLGMMEVVKQDIHEQVRLDALAESLGEFAEAARKERDDG